MNITLTKTNAYSKEEVALSFIENPDFSKTVKIEELSDNDKNLIYDFCSENAFSTISIPQAFPLNISIKLVNIEITEGVKEVLNITNKDTVQKTGILLDLVTNLLTKEEA